METRGVYRYSKEENTVYVDIQIDFYREIYNEWDFSPLVKRDIDQDLIDYLEDCADEINNKYKLCIVFHIPKKIQSQYKEKKSIKGFYNYFNYEIKKQSIQFSKLRKQGIYYCLLGFGLLTLGFFIDKGIREGSPVIILSEGLLVGGWVLFWELFTIVFFKSKEFLDKKTSLERLRDAKIEYKTR